MQQVFVAMLADPEVFCVSRRQQKKVRGFFAGADKDLFGLRFPIFCSRQDLLFGQNCPVRLESYRPRLS